MPTRGYRKGRFDSKEPVPRFVRTRLSDQEFAELQSAAAGRGMTLSKLLRTLVVAFVRNERLALPQNRATNNAALRELCRIGNNINQLTRQANAGLVPVAADELRACVARINDIARTL